jgi:hypothetical protein
MELFTTIGKVDRAEIGYETSGRSRGIGVVQFDGMETADTAIQKFQGYMYGGRYSPHSATLTCKPILIPDHSDCHTSNKWVPAAPIAWWKDKSSLLPATMVNTYLTYFLSSFLFFFAPPQKLLLVNSLSLSFFVWRGNVCIVSCFWRVS